MKISKYSASGNDFVIFHTFKNVPRNNLAIKLCNRTEGVGADGLIVLLPSQKYDFEWQFYNSDGSEPNMCGNGSRAAAHYAFTNKLVNANMNFLTKAGVICANVDKNDVQSQLTKPLTLQTPFKEFDKIWHFYDTGVPHLVTFVDDLQTCWNEQTIKFMREKYNANVNFAKLDNALHVRTFERGVEGETKACGTGMAACFLAAYDEKKLSNSSKVIPKSGEILEVKMQDSILFLKGEVKHVFDCVVKNL